MFLDENLGLCSAVKDFSEIIDNNVNLRRTYGKAATKVTIFVSGLVTDTRAKPSISSVDSNL